VSIATDILKSHHIGIRDLKEHLSKLLKTNEPLVVTDRGTPVNVILPYSDMLELMDILDELSDLETLQAIQQGRKAIKTGAQGIPVSKLFNKIKPKHK